MIKPFEKPIYVTRPFLPPFEEFCQGLGEIWETRWLTNNGPILRRFTQELCNFFETENVCMFNNRFTGDDLIRPILLRQNPNLRKDHHLRREAATIIHYTS